MFDDLQALGATSDARHRGRRYPDGWTPRVEYDDAGGTIISTPWKDGEDRPDDADLFRLHDLDPGQWRIVKARSSRWQHHPEGPWLNASRIEFVPAGALLAAEDADELVSRISTWRPRFPKTSTERSFWAPMGDTQIGKVEGGGTPATIDRVLAEVERQVGRQRDLKAERVVLPWMGDCIEGIVSQGGKIQGRIDLTITEQVRIFRRLVSAQIKAFLPYSEQILVVGIPGNHDETTRDLFTVGSDSWSLEAISAVQDGIKENPELQNRVEFLFPSRDSLDVTVDQDDVRVTMVHGHQFPNRAEYWRVWWEGQAAARLLPGDADVLIAAHRHHLAVQDFAGGRVFIQIPAMDGGSRWFDNRRGGNVPSRSISFLLEDGRIRNLDPVL